MTGFWSRFYRGAMACAGVAVIVHVIALQLSLALLQFALVAFMWLYYDECRRFAKFREDVRRVLR